MAEEDEALAGEAEDAPKKKSKLPMILGLVLALAGGGGSFFTIYSGMLLGGDSHAAAEHGETGAENENRDHIALPDVVFVPVDPLVISMARGAANHHLRFRAELEVPTQYQEDVEKLLPRVVDVLNSYLRALEIDDVTDAAALVRLRSQMLRRIRVVLGEERVNDLLIMEFVLN